MMKANSNYFTSNYLYILLYFFLNSIHPFSTAEVGWKEFTVKDDLKAS